MKNTLLSCHPLSSGRNVALYQPSIQSSEYQRHPNGISKYPASVAVDGDLQVSFNHGSCTASATNALDQGVWYLFYRQPQIIYRILVYNRDGKFIWNGNASVLTELVYNISSPCSISVTCLLTTFL